MSKWALALATVALMAVGADGAARASELALANRPAAREVFADPCPRCGCLRVSYVRHRELRATYGRNFDPRDYDRSEPTYFLAGMRNYPRYWCEYPR